MPLNVAVVIRIALVIWVTAAPSTEVAVGTVLLLDVCTLVMKLVVIDCGMGMDAALRQERKSAIVQSRVMEPAVSARSRCLFRSLFFAGLTPCCEMPNLHPLRQSQLPK